MLRGYKVADVPAIMGIDGRVPRRDGQVNPCTWISWLFIERSGPLA